MPFRISQPTNGTRITKITNAFTEKDAETICNDMKTQRCEMFYKMPDVDTMLNLLNPNFPPDQQLTAETLPNVLPLYNALIDKLVHIVWYMSIDFSVPYAKYLIIDPTSDLETFDNVVADNKYKIIRGPFYHNEKSAVGKFNTEPQYGPISNVFTSASATDPNAFGNMFAFGWDTNLGIGGVGDFSADLGFAIAPSPIYGHYELLKIGTEVYYKKVPEPTPP